MDFVLGLVLLVVFLPVILVAALVVRLTSSGPAFYTQTRVGKGGRHFRIYKIRTMYHNVERISGIRWSTPGDNRITPVGRLLRRTHIDELPQLFNVLRADMSLVGPRPERPEIIAGLEGPIPEFRARLHVRPGVTGLAQLRLPADVDIPGVRRKLKFDLYYIRNIGPWLDIRLIACTGLKMLGVPLGGALAFLGIPGKEVLGEENPTRPLRARIRRMALQSVRIVMCLALAFAAHVGWNSYRYGIPVLRSVKGTVREIGLECIRLGTWVYDPSSPRYAQLEPTDKLEATDYRRIEDTFPIGVSTAIDGGLVVATEISNAQIVRGRYSFDYQIYDEPRLVELRRKYRLDSVIASAKTEFEAMVLLRNWARSQFRRRDYQPEPVDFDALEVLDRNLRDRSESYIRGIHMDPCHFFPMFYSQILLSVGYTARMLSTHHGVVEVWSNQYRKWVMMDAELNFHIEEGGVPCNAADLSRIGATTDSSLVRIVHGHQWSGDETTSIVHLGIKELSAAQVIPWYNHRLEFHMRNDWMTNRYFPGHPKRSDQSSLVFTSPSFAGDSAPFEKRLCPRTSDEADCYWTLNQTAVQVCPAQGSLTLLFDTVTPNFECFEVAIDNAQPIQLPRSSYQWRLHDGENRLAVRTLNRFGHRGIESVFKLSYSPGAR